MSEQKSPEQIAAEQKLEAQRKEAEAKAAADRLAAKKEKAGVAHFVFGDRVYKLKYKQVNIPDIGVRTALEVYVDVDAQKILAEHHADTLLIEVE